MTVERPAIPMTLASAAYGAPLHGLAKCNLYFLGLEASFQPSFFIYQVLDVRGTFAAHHLRESFGSQGKSARNL